MPRSRILQPDRTYTFHSYFELRFSTADILAELGYSFSRSYLKLPELTETLPFIDPLERRIKAYLPYINLNSEAARRETLAAPLILEIVSYSQASLEIEYPITINNYLKGELDYYLHKQGSLIVIEAKNSDLTRGFTQLAIELIALHQWLVPDESENASENEAGTESSPSNLLYGAVTTGDIWRFGCYDTQAKQIIHDLNTYRVPEDIKMVASSLTAILQKPITS